MRAVTRRFSVQLERPGEDWRDVAHTVDTERILGGELMGFIAWCFSDNQEPRHAHLLLEAANPNAKESGSRYTPMEFTIIAASPGFSP